TRSAAESFPNPSQRELVDDSSPTCRPPLFESDALRGERTLMLENSLELRAKRQAFEIALLGWT
ncbi:MAG TPA: hypothetical protein VIJ87_14495, partial [Pyrinomonadaceae bacterium]